MTETPILLPDARADIADAFQWYEEQSMGLGMEFLRCVVYSVFHCSQDPEKWRSRLPI